jgi:hypothetical protein
LLDRARKAYGRFDSAKPFWKSAGRGIAAPLVPPAAEPPF